MEDYWPSYKGSSESLWKHEWIKHGVHAILPDIDNNAISRTSDRHHQHYNTMIYFRTTIELYHLLNINLALPKHNLLSKPKAYCKQIQSFVDSVYDMNAITVRRSSNLIEIRICLHICPCRQVVFICSIANN